VVEDRALLPHAHRLLHQVQVQAGELTAYGAVPSGDPQRRVAGGAHGGAVRAVAAPRAPAAQGQERVTGHDPMTLHKVKDE